MISGCLRSCFGELLKADESFDFHVVPGTVLPELSYVYNFNWKCNHCWHVSVALTLCWEEQAWQPLKRHIMLRDETSIWTLVFVADSFKNWLVGRGKKNRFAQSTKWCLWTNSVSLEGNGWDVKLSWQEICYYVWDEFHQYATCIEQNNRL